MADFRYHLSDVGTFGGGWSVAGDLNNKGQVAGGASRASGIRRAFVYENGVLRDIGSLFGENGESIAGAINERGQLAGQCETAPQVYEHSAAWNAQSAREANIFEKEFIRIGVIVTHRASNVKKVNEQR